MDSTAGELLGKRSIADCRCEESFSLTSRSELFSHCSRARRAVRSWFSLCSAAVAAPLSALSACTPPTPQPAAATSSAGPFHSSVEIIGATCLRKDRFTQLRRMLKYVWRTEGRLPAQTGGSAVSRFPQRAASEYIQQQTVRRLVLLLM